MQIATQSLQASGLASWAGVEENPPIPSSPIKQQQQGNNGSTANGTGSNKSNGNGSVINGSIAADNGVTIDTKSNGNGNGKQPFDVFETLPSKGPFWPAGSMYAAAAPLTAETQRKKAFAAAAREMYLGVTSIPLPITGDVEGYRQQVSSCAGVSFVYVFVCS